MRKIEDLTSCKFGKLVPIKVIGRKNRYAYWECKCDCGNTTYATSSNLKGGNVKSCGCLSNEIKTKHNCACRGKKTRLYNIWCDIHRRCYCKTSHAYEYYGGRGIEMCDEWKNNYEMFKNWAESNGYEDTLSIDRIDNNLGYCPENCKWIPKNEQSLNRRYCIMVYGMPLRTYCRSHNLAYSTYRQYFHKYGMDALICRLESKEVKA